MKNKDFDTFILNTWREITKSTPPSIQEKIVALLNDVAPKLVDEFYKVLLTDPKTKVFLAHETVNKRLRASLEQWLLHLFTISSENEFLAFTARQIEIGNIHSRIKLPSYMMGMGYQALRSSLRKQLGKLSLTPEEQSLAQLYISDLLNLSENLMMNAYIHDVKSTTRADEAYKAIALKHDVILERERQNSAILDWENKLLFSFRFQGHDIKPTKLANSEFGMWLSHKSRILFEDMPDTHTLLDLMAHIDNVILPQLDHRLSREAEAIKFFEELKSKLDLIRYLLGSLFDRLNGIDQGRDTVTGLYNRKHLGAVLTRELQQHSNDKKRFGVMLIRIDNLELVAVTEEARDGLLQQTSVLMVEFARTSDYIFRYGRSEFLILVVETNEKSLTHLAEDLRSRLMNHQFFLRDKHSVSLASSIGAALYDGHPDYLQLLKKAEHALILAAVRGDKKLVFSREENWDTASLDS